MSFKFVFGFVVINLVFRQIESVPSSCVTCINCLDVYDGTDASYSCSSTTANADSCQKIRIQLPGTTLISKACARNCKEQSIVAGPIRLDISCCTTNNCNTASTVILQSILFFLPFILLLI